MNKICTRCRVALPATKKYFYEREKSADGFRSWCKKCESNYSKEFRREHKNELNEKSKAYYALNKEDIIEQKKEYRSKHREELKEYHKKYHENVRKKLAIKK